MEPFSESPPQSRTWGFWLGLAALLAFWLWPTLGKYGQEQTLMLRAGGIALLVSLWWITEAVPLGAASLVPLVVMPLAGVASIEQMAVKYADRTVFLFMGGFLVALALEESGLHRRLALHIVKGIGGGPHRVLLGFMIATAALSMWTSNSACTLMMLPIAANVAAECRGEARGAKSFGALLMLGVAYAASIGGMGTPIGTPVNATVLSFARQRAPEAHLTFPQWMAIGVPLLSLYVLAAWIVLALGIKRGAEFSKRDVINEAIAKLGPLRRHEMILACLFGCTALAWIFRAPTQNFGWVHLLPYIGMGGSEPPAWIDDAAVAIGAAILCFIVPRGDGKKACLDASAFTKVPWDVLLLFGGGLALGDGLKIAKVDHVIGTFFASSLGTLPTWGQAASTAFGVTFLSEFMSNVACVNMVMPALLGAANAMGVSPVTLLLPAAFAASCGFMMPIGTPPNAIAYATGKVRLSQMLFYGAMIDLIGVALITIASLTLGPLVVGK